MKKNILKYVSILLLMCCTSFAFGDWASKRNFNVPLKNAPVVTYAVGTSPKKISVHSKDVPRGLIKARLTVYWANGKGTDRWSKRRESATGVRLNNGHCAVDLRKIPAGSRVEVYDPNTGKKIDSMIAVDTGTAVRNKVASNGRCLVIDKFFVDKSEARRYDYSTPDYVMIKIL